MRRHSLCTAIVSAALLSACVGTTGGDVIDFPAAAAGPTDAQVGKPLVFDTDRGFHVVLTKATLHIGAVYLNQSQPVSGSQATTCILPGTYVAQVTSGLDVDLLSPTPQRFPTLGHGTTLDALIGQVWLSGGADDHDLDNASDTTPILVIEGTADSGGVSRPFKGTVTIATNRQAPSGEIAGAGTICKQRIVSPIPTRVALKHDGGLLVRIDPRRLFVNVDFAELGKVSSGFVFSDEPSQTDPTSPLYYSQPSVNLYQNLHSAGTISPLYDFVWDDTLR